MQPTAPVGINGAANVMKVHTPLICGGHSRPVPFLSYSDVTEDGFFLISACLGTSLFGDFIFPPVIEIKFLPTQTERRC